MALIILETRLESAAWRYCPAYRRYRMRRWLRDTYPQHPQQRSGWWDLLTDWAFLGMLAAVTLLVMLYTD